MSSRAHRIVTATGIAALAIGVGACGGRPDVVRVYDGTIRTGSFIPPEAYASYLRGALAEASGDDGTALGFFERAADEDSEDPAAYIRIGDLRCRKKPDDARADQAFAKALDRDPTSASALAAKSRCAARRGKPEEEEVLAARAAAEDPRSVDLEAALVRSSAAKLSVDGRARALALTTAHGDREAAWDALAVWSRSHDDADLFERALAGLLRTAPTRSPDIERGALALLGDGHLIEARRLAAHVADAPRELDVRGPRNATVARLAVDAALVAGDRLLAERRAVRGRVPLAEVGARALLLGQDVVAAELTVRVLAADPTSSGAELVRLSLDKGAGPVASPFTHRSDVPPLANVVVFAERLARAGDSAGAREFFASMPRAAMAAHDPIVGPLLVDLAARGLVEDAALDEELRVDLAARRRTPPPPLREDGAEVDAVHRLLWLALTEPTKDDAVNAAARLRASATQNAYVAYSLLRIGMAKSADVSATGERISQALAAFPANPLLLAAGVEIATRTGIGVDAARTRLMAVARTPAERRLAALAE